MANQETRMVVQLNGDPEATPTTINKRTSMKDEVGGDTFKPNEDAAERDAVRYLYCIVLSLKERGPFKTKEVMFASCC